MAHFDVTNRAARGPRDRQAVVEHVVSGGDALLETDWLEWKTAVDLTSATGRGAAARAILGFANRRPDRAARNAEGAAYLVVGAEPRNLVGVPAHDSVELEDWLRPYVGDNVVFDPSYVSIDDRLVLLVQVAAPSPGDPPHPLRRGYDDLAGKQIPAGTLFVRKPGKTERANADDVDMLAERARAKVDEGLELDLTIEVEGELFSLPAGWFDERTCRQHMTQEEARLRVGVPEVSERSMALGLARSGETRRPDEYLVEVHDYIEALKQNWRNIVSVVAAESRLVALLLIIRNNTVENFDDVQLELEVPDLKPQWAMLDVGDARGLFEVPSPPRAWGAFTKIPVRDWITEAQARTNLAGVVERGEDDVGTAVRFTPLHVRPGGRHRLDPLILIPPPELANTTLSIGWRVTSRSTRGDRTGRLELPVRSGEEAPWASRPLELTVDG